MASRRVIVAILVSAGVTATGLFVHARGSEPRGAQQGTPGLYKVARRDFVQLVRLSGTVEAVQATTIAAPRLSGQGNNSLVITRLVPAGRSVKPGDLIVEFDRQDQVRTALDRRADLNDLEQQIKKREAQEAAARAADDSTHVQAQSAVERARLEIVKNEMLPKIQAEKNTLALEEAQARLKQLEETYDLKRAAATADIRVLQIRRHRAESNMKQAESNAERMLINSPIAGVAVVKTTWKQSGMAEIAEGEEVRSGMPVVEVVNPSSMRVRARVNQADINDLKIGQPVRVGLDAYPDLQFAGTIDQISPLGVPSTLSPKVRNFIVLIAVQGSHPNLMPDLTASLDVELSRVPGVLVVPREAVLQDAQGVFVRVQRGSGFERQAVSLGAQNSHEVVVTSGLGEGAVVARHATAAAR